MNKPEKITVYNVPDIRMVPDGYYMKDQIELTQENLEYVIEQHNNLVEVVNMLCEKSGIVFDD